MKFILKSDEVASDVAVCNIEDEGGFGVDYRVTLKFYCDLTLETLSKSA
jgi:hypothetical protein